MRESACEKCGKIRKDQDDAWIRPLCDSCMKDNYHRCADCGHVVVPVDVDVCTSCEVKREKAQKRFDSSLSPGSEFEKLLTKSQERSRGQIADFTKILEREKIIKDKKRGRCYRCDSPIVTIGDSLPRVLCGECDESQLTTYKIRHTTSDLVAMDVVAEVVSGIWRSSLLEGERVILEKTEGGWDIYTEFYDNSKPDVFPRD